MEQLRWFQTPEFAALWKQSFDGVHAVLREAHGQCHKPKVYVERGSLWVEISEPLLGLRLIAVELPLRILPPRLYLRSWAYDPAGSASYDKLRVNRFVHDGTQAVRYDNEQPRPSWQAQLGETRLKGLRDSVDLSSLEHLPLQQAAPEARRIVSKYCDYVVATLAAVPQVDTVAHETVDPAADLAPVAVDPRFQDAPPPVRIALANARIGQGSYRQRLLTVWERRCALSGCSVEAVLVASHSRAWSLCETAAQCLDEYNGLLLTATLDRLFDQGLIAFSDTGQVLTKGDDAVKALLPAPSLRFVHERHLPYLAWHRQRFGFGL